MKRFWTLVLMGTLLFSGQRLVAADLRDMSVDVRIDKRSAVSGHTRSRHCRLVYNRALSMQAFTVDGELVTYFVGADGAEATVYREEDGSLPTFGLWCEPLFRKRETKRLPDQAIDDFEGNRLVCQVERFQQQGATITRWRSEDGRLCQVSVSEGQRQFVFSFGLRTINTGAGKELLLSEKDGDQWLAVGQPIPVLTASTVDGKPVLPVDKDVRALALEFYSDNCSACQAGLLGLQLLAYRHRAIQFVIVSIDPDCASLLQRMKEYEIELPVVHDGTRTIMKQFQVRSIPEIVLIDGHSKLVWRGHPVSPELLTAMGQFAE